MKIKNKQELKSLKAGGRILSEILANLRDQLQPGITTNELNKLAEELIAKYKAKPSFKGFAGYPASLCTSVNEQLVHGLPSQYALQSGDIIGLDCGIWYQGFCTDMALTVAVGKVANIVTDLIEVTKQSLAIGLSQVKPGQTVGDYGAAVQDFVEGKGFSVIRGLVGHGVGRQVHEEPRVPNFGNRGEGFRFEEGMVLAFEPMVSIGDYEIITGNDGWTIFMADKSLSAHFELTALVTKNGYELITPKIW